jgi:hypothetical protein
VAGAAVIAGLGTAAWYRGLFRRALEGAKQELDGLLGSVERHVTKQALFGDSPEAWKALRDTRVER